MRRVGARCRGAGKAKGRTLWDPAFWDKAPGDDLLLHGERHTTIGAAAFHFRVRDGIGWFHSAMVARETVERRGLRCGCSRAVSLEGIRDVARVFRRTAPSCRRGANQTINAWRAPRPSILDPDPPQHHARSMLLLDSPHRMCGLFVAQRAGMHAETVLAR